MVAIGGERERQLVSYTTLRKLIGLFGLILPIALPLGCLALDEPTQASISEYYGTGMRNVFVGVLFTVGWFLFTYRGYDDTDDRLGDAACFAALGVALFPITSDATWVHGVHYASAGTLFSLFAVFAGLRFTKSSAATPTDRKRQRNRLYRICAGLIVGCIAAMALAELAIARETRQRYQLVFWIEAIALAAFALSWLVKGEALLADEPSDPRQP